MTQGRDLTLPTGSESLVTRWVGAEEPGIIRSVEVNDNLPRPHWWR